ncbi:MAG: hypothetical protein C0598_06190 [Marinilabiliales bacterium]|nr:MAG: hypothetical protein C0598_06190 [Marinilabiliales bacterium]
MKKYYLIIFLSLIAYYAKCQIDAGPDSTICIGETIMLQGSGPGMYSYTWTSVPDDPTISDPNILTPTVSPIDTTVYTLEARSVSLINLVSNGDFEQGNNGDFTSEYTYSPGANGLWNEGTYAITADASFNHDNFFCDNDHTSGSGNFMAVNGAGQANVVVWSTTITGITQDTEYEFSTWVASLSPISPAILQFKINGELLGSPFTASNFTCLWKRFFETWNSGNSTSATISIVNQNTATNGNDFSLDDINFNAVSYFYDECTVNVRDIPTSTFDLVSESCSLDTVTVTYTGTASASAIYNWGFGSANIITGSGQGPYELTWNTSGLKTISLMVEEGCESVLTSHNINVKQSPESQLTADATSIPYGTTTTLHGFMDGSPGPLDFQWIPDNLLQDPLSQDPQTITLENSALFTFEVIDQSSLCSNWDTLTINVTGGPLTILSLEALPDTICLGDNSDIQINIEGGSGSYTSTWTSDPPGYNHSGSETTINVQPSETTTYYVEVTDGFATLPSESIKIVVIPLVEILLQPSDTLIEPGDIAIFEVDGLNNHSFQWQLSTDDGLSWNDINDNTYYSGTTTNTLTVSNTTIEMNSYLFRCLLDGRCSPLFSNEALLKVSLSPEVIGGLEDITVCENETVSLAFSITNFIVIDSLNFIATFDNSITSFVDISDINNSISSLQYYTSNDSIYILWKDNIGQTIEDSKIFTINFIADAAGIAEIDFSNNSIIRNNSGFYPPLSLNSSTVVINPLPQIPDQIIATPDSLNILDEINITLEAIGGLGDELVWTNESCDGNIIGNSNPLVIYRPEETTNYYAKYENQCGITDCETVKVQISEQFIFAIPNAFSPNGDELNDNFGVFSSGNLAFFEMNIFDRWGQLIFSTNDQNEKWDGKINGKSAPVGVYVYKVNYQFKDEGINSEKQKHTGTLTLLR